MTRARKKELINELRKAIEQQGAHQLGVMSIPGAIQMLIKDIEDKTRVIQALCDILTEVVLDLPDEA